ncbi:casein kinase substrate phosphoprotein PP28-domain-containing protein [Geopyxis carbonaria]|nr:casein kinase substrate phosphoprotein PP28-domain-containing protein [Geopyxis carbonaria]
MAPGAPRSKRKPVRGKGKSFSRNLRPLEDEPDIPDSAVDAQASGDDNSSDEDESEDDNGGTSEPLTREERKAAAKAKKEAARARLVGNEGQSDSDEQSDSDVLKPQMTTARVRGGISVRNPNDPSNASEGLSRREREAVEAAAAKERYWKLQEAGKTDQAKADMARLTLIRQEREEKAKQRKAEMDEKKAAAEVKAAQRGGKKR